LAAAGEHLNSALSPVVLELLGVKYEVLNVVVLGVDALKKAARVEVLDEQVSNWSRSSSYLLFHQCLRDYAAPDMMGSV
jgi:hypothetical protein